MSRRDRLGVLILLLLILLLQAGFGCDPESIPRQPAAVRQPHTRITFLRRDGTGVASITARIAATPAQRTQGLMGRRSLEWTEGMLFVYPDSASRVFWMHNTPLSLDIIFIDAHKRIINIAESTAPLSDQRYRSAAPSQYVLEVRAGFVQRHQIQPGMRIRW